jgi:hypothetical protein
MGLIKGLKETPFSSWPGLSRPSTFLLLKSMLQVDMKGPIGGMGYR